MRKATFLLLLLAGLNTIAQDAKETADRLYHQFDFWLGNWDVYKYNTDTLVGHSRIESIIDSVGLLENYSVAKGRYQGKSLNKYNPVKGRWEQYWIDNSGLTLFLTGGLIAGKMTLDDVGYDTTQIRNNKISWQKIDQDTVRQTWSISNDGGATWSVVFDGEYRKLTLPE